MNLKNLTALDKCLFLIGNLFLIGINQQFLSQIVLSIYFFAIFFLMDVPWKRKSFFLIPGIIFLVPTLLVSGVKMDKNMIFFQIDYSTALRSISTLIATGIFAMNSSLKEICHLMKKIGMPDLFIEVIIYMFKFINIMYLGSREVKLAILNRGGFQNFRNSRRDTALFFKILFQKVSLNLENYNSALLSRGYRGHFPLLSASPDANVTPMRISLLLLYVISTTLFLRGVQCLN